MNTSSQVLTDPNARLRAAYECPDWCLTSLRDHGDDDPARPLHDGPVIANGSFTVTQVGADNPQVYLHQREGEMTSVECRQLAADALTAAQWLEARS